MVVDLDSRLKNRSQLRIYSKDGDSLFIPKRPSLFHCRRSVKYGTTVGFDPNLTVENIYNLLEV